MTSDDQLRRDLEHPLVALLVRARKLGLPALIVLILILICIAGWWWSDALSTKPGVRQILTYLHTEDLPQRVDGTLNIAVALLDHDSEGEKWRFLLSQFEKYGGVTVLPIERNITESGDSNARALLLETRADVLIWGDVITFDQRSALRLRFMAADTPLTLNRPEAYIPDLHTFQLPEIFENDLAHIVGVLVCDRLSRPLSNQGSRPLDGSFEHDVASVEKLISDRTLTWTEAERSSVLQLLANGFRVLGSQRNDVARLNRAKEIYHNILTGISAAAEPRRWAVVQHDLATTLALIGEKTSDVELFRQSAVHFERTLSVRTEAGDPTNWAITNAALAGCYIELAVRDKNLAYLERAAALLENAQRALRREQWPTEWALLQRISARESLKRAGFLLQSLSRNEISAEEFRSQRRMLLQEAVRKLREGLSELRRDKAPLLWAQQQSDLGSALKALGDAEEDAAIVILATDAYNAALEELSATSTPYTWALTHMNLAGAHIWLGRHGSDGLPSYKAAEKSYLLSYAYFRSVNDPNYTETVRVWLEHTRSEIASRN